MIPAASRHFGTKSALLAAWVRQKLPGRLAAVMLLVGLAQPLLAISSGTAVPDRGSRAAAAPSTSRLSPEGWDGFTWGMSAEQVAQLSMARGLELVTSQSGETAELRPVSGPCRFGWARDRLCERVVLRFRPQGSGAPRLHAVTVEMTLPRLTSAEDVVGELVSRFGAPLAFSTNDADHHPRERPELRYRWQMEGLRGGAQAELALPSLLLGELSGWRLVASEREPAGAARHLADAQ